MAISRQIRCAESECYDVVIVGGGIYGAMLLLEAARQGWSVLLLERQDFGAGTSYNSLRIIHGGLRYLQHLDLMRFRESVSERKWFLQTFPDLVKPLPCLMPLYDRGLRRLGIFRAALWINDLLSTKRNDDVAKTNTLANGRILDPQETRQLFPDVEPNGLSGAALWYDAHMPDSQRVLIETLHWACSMGARATNYVEVNELLKTGNTVAGIRSTDRETGHSFEIRSKIVVNATGPDTRTVASQWDRDIPLLYHRSLAWNVLFDLPAPSTHALALKPDQPGGRMYFLHPWKGRLLAGTGHAPWKQSFGGPDPGSEELEKFIHDLNLVLPKAELSLDKIVRIYSGFLPAKQDGGVKLSDRAVIHDHGRQGGPQGLYSVSGVKFTTARKVAEQTLRCVLNGGRLAKRKSPFPLERPTTSSSAMTSLDYNWMPLVNDPTWKSDLDALIKQESVLHLDDLVLRRTGIGDNPRRAKELAADIAALFDWDDAKRDQEIKALLN